MFSRKEESVKCQGNQVHGNEGQTVYTPVSLGFLRMKKFGQIFGDEGIIEGHHQRIHLQFKQHLQGLIETMNRLGGQRSHVDQLINMEANMCDSELPARGP